MKTNPAILAIIVATSIIACFLLSCGLTVLIRRYALQVNMLDSPNDRTLHQGQVPRGGGLSIVLTMLLALLLLWYTSPNPAMPFMLAILILFGGLGWVDDRFGLSPFTKIAIQFAVAIVVVTNIGALDGVSIAGFSFSFGIAATVFSVLWIVWMTNAYNFMDGIDGIAASHAAIIACVMGAWFALDQNSALAIFCYVIMAAALGFLVWNWEPARIFMGDVGSVTLGGIFAVLAIIGNSDHGVPITAYIVLFGVFLFDTIITLLRRLFHGKVIWQPHREHFYQRAVALGFGHAQVTVATVIAALVLAVLASLERFNVSPTGLWPLLALLILTALALTIHFKEKGASRHP